jgi:N-acetylmuramoyl-L-alanine amidase
MKILFTTVLVALLAGCASVPHIDKTYCAKGQSSRVKFVILHYTVSDLPTSINALTKNVVSSHYLLTDETAPKIYGLVDEMRQSNHAGVSHWKNYTLLNGSSVGIEIVNPGHTFDSTGARIWYPYPQAQIDQLIVLLKQIVARHQVAPENILGHSDIAPQRKQDPGPLFPWYQLAQHGLIAWPDAGKVAAARLVFEQQMPDVAWFQKKLAAHGYAILQSGDLDEQTRNVISAFQMKYRPVVIDGLPDLETAALLEALSGAPAAP